MTRKPTPATKATKATAGKKPATTTATTRKTSGKTTGRTAGKASTRTTGSGDKTTAKNAATQAGTQTGKDPDEKPPRAPRQRQHSSATVHVSAADRQAKAQVEWSAVRDGTGSITAGLFAGLPALPEGDMWLDVTWVSVILKRPAKTITYWVSVGWPDHRPFPKPRQYLRINLWTLSEVLAWAHAEGYLAHLPPHLIPKPAKRRTPAKRTRPGRPAH